MFAATPPLEAKKILFSLAASTDNQNSTDPMKLLFIDVRRAFFYAKAKRDICVRLPPEDDEPGMCGKLCKAMYGTRDAPALWENDYSQRLISEGFLQGASTPCVFIHSHYNLRLVVHGDDFTFFGDSAGLRFARKIMSKHYDVKIRGVLGPEDGDEKHIRILNRCLSWSSRASTMRPTSAMWKFWSATSNKNWLAALVSLHLV